MHWVSETKVCIAYLPKNNYIEGPPISETHTAFTFIINGVVLFISSTQFRWQVNYAGKNDNLLALSHGRA